MLLKFCQKGVKNPIKNVFLWDFEISVIELKKR